MITIPQNAVLQPSGYHDLVHAVVPIDENGNRLGGAASPMQTKSVDDTGNRVGSAASPVHTETPDGFFTTSVNFTRPADTTAYAAGDRVADLTVAATILEFTNVARATGEAVRIERIRMRKTGVTLTNASFRVHLFRTLPTVNVNDNGVFNNASVLALADIAGYVGTIDVTMNLAAVIGARGVGIPSAGNGITIEAAGTVGHETSIWAVVEALAAYVPASAETFTITLEAARS